MEYERDYKLAGKLTKEEKGLIKAYINFQNANYKVDIGDAENLQRVLWGMIRKPRDDRDTLELLDDFIILSIQKIIDEDKKINDFIMNMKDEEY